LNSKQELLQVHQSVS